MANTPMRVGHTAYLTAGATAIDPGVLIMVKTSDGLGYKATDSSGAGVVGVAREAVAASATFVAAKGVFGFTNSTGGAITANDIGKICYVESTTGYTVALSGTSCAMKAGTVVDVDSNYVWVDVGVDSAINYTT